jgi:hypothetical protein
MRNIAITMTRLLFLSNIYLTPFLLTVASLSLFLVHPNTLSVELTRILIGDPIYSNFQHAFLSYHIAIILVLMFFLIALTIEQKSKINRRLRLFILSFISLFSLFIDRFITSARLISSDPLSLLFPKLIFFVVIFFVMYTLYTIFRMFFTAYILNK